MEMKRLTEEDVSLTFSEKLKDYAKGIAALSATKKEPTLCKQIRVEVASTQTEELRNGKYKL